MTVPSHATSPAAPPLPRSVWLAARGRNAVRHPAFLAAAGGGALVATVVALLLAPRSTESVGRVETTAPVRIDTAALLDATRRGQTRLAAAESALTVTRQRMAVVTAAATVDTLSPAALARRDSISTRLGELQTLIGRVETVPLASSYRALAGSPSLSGNERVRALLDTLTEIERDREALGSAGGADPIYVALTTRATEIGRAIQSIAEARRDELRAEAQSIAAPQQRRRVLLAEVDTMPWVAERDSARSAIATATQEIEAARERYAEYEEATRINRAAAVVTAPIFAVLGAALVFGVAFGFGVAFRKEIRRPRIADVQEVERLTGLRVLAVIRKGPRTVERGRRLADREAPPYIDPRADGYQLTYLHVARTGASLLMLTVAGDEPSIAAVVAGNLATIAANEARSTVVVDLAVAAAPVAAALRVRAEPGLADVLVGRTGWVDATTQAVVGRHTVVDVVPGGFGSIPTQGELTRLLRSDAARLGRYYDAVLFVSTYEQAAGGFPGVLPIGDVVLCARLGHTPIRELAQHVEAIRATGGNPLGVVIWDAPPPALPPAERIAAAPRPLHTQEMKALTDR